MVIYSFISHTHTHTHTPHVTIGLAMYEVSLLTDYAGTSVVARGLAHVLIRTLPEPFG